MKPVHSIDSLRRKGVGRAFYVGKHDGQTFIKFISPRK